MSTTRTNLNTSLETMISGSYSSGDFETIINRAVKRVLLDLDLNSAIREEALDPNLCSDVFQYSAPSDLKGEKIIDIKPQVNRGEHHRWRFTSSEEFDRLKDRLRINQWGERVDINARGDWMGENLVAIEHDNMGKLILLSRPVDDDRIAIDDMDAVEDWTGFGDGENLTKDSGNYVKGSASINWDIDDSGGTTAGIENESLTSFDISDYKTTGSIFVWAYISDATDVTNFIVRVGSSSSDYYSITITSDTASNDFKDGWNLLRFDLSDKSTTGSPDDDDCTYVAIYMTKDSGKTSETDYRFDWLVIRRGKHYSVVYYSKYGWKSDGGTWKEESDSNSDIIIADGQEEEIILEKAAELMEKHLRNHSMAENHRQLYVSLTNRYLKQYPSRAMSKSMRYYNL